MRYAPLNSAKSLSPTRSTRLTSRILLIMTIKDLYKRFEKSAEKTAPGTPKCTQHSLDSQNKPAASLSTNQNTATTLKLPAQNKDSTMIQRTEKFTYGAVKWTHRSPANQLARIQTHSRPLRWLPRLVSWLWQMRSLKPLLLNHVIILSLPSISLSAN